MTALGDAIAKRRPAETLSATSPLAGLRRRTVTSKDLVAQSIATVAPAGVLLVNPVGLFAEGGSFAAVELAITAFLITLITLGILIFARRIAAAGSLYTFVTRGLGPSAGMAAGAALILGYLALAVITLREAANSAATLISTAVTGTGTDTGAPPSVPWLPMVIAIVIGGVIVVVAACGARPSTRVMLAVEVVAVGLIIAVSFVVLAVSGWDLSPLVPDVSNPPSFASVVAGVGFGFNAFVGFESGVALGPESKRPLATVPRALIWTVAVVCVVYLIGVSAQFAVIAEAPDETFESLFQVASGHLALPGASLVTHAIVAASFAACALASISALVRLVFTLAREGVMPAALGVASPRFGTPSRAALLAGIVVVALALVLMLIPGRSLIGMIVSVASTTGFVIAYLLVCVAGPLFLRRIKEFTVYEATPAGFAALALAVVVVGQVMTVRPERAQALFVVLGVVLVSALVHRVRIARDPGIRARSGLYDSPVSSDGISSRDRGLGEGVSTTGSAP